jgi:cobalt-precorrin 5A hydrolase/precorrin-3B C17-methyltransferase
VRRALALAGEGRNVTLISSGDPGVYAMATLVFECLESGDVPDSARRAEIVVAPGISAMQAAAARAGAPLGHDFCAISLSDLLTPWETIEARIRAAAEADFVIAFYNPVSERRRTQLARAKDILLLHRPSETPVLLARNLGREGETVMTVPLAELEIGTVDMLTVVVVGSSTTRQVNAGGRAWTFTPRGYAARRPLSQRERVPAKREGKGLPALPSARHVPERAAAEGHSHPSVAPHPPAQPVLGPAEGRTRGRAPSPSGRRGRATKFAPPRQGD